MRVFRISDGSSWTARVQEGATDVVAEPRPGYDAIVFDADPVAATQRLVYRPPGWLEQASVADLVAALEEGVVVRARWG